MSGNNVGEKLVVVPYKPGDAIKKRLYMWAVVVFTALVFVMLGYCYGDIKTQQLTEQNRRLQEQLELANQRATDSANRLVALEQEKAIDAVAKTHSQEMLKELQFNVQRLTRDLAFYKGIMEPVEGASGLQISQFDVKPSRTAGRYQYKLVLTQITENAAVIEGQVDIVLIGKQQGKEFKFPMPFADGGKQVAFRFRYFQDIEGEFLLPEGFAPEQIQVIAQPRGKKGTKLERVFNWESGA
jgi:hypothetical protein